MRVEISRHSSGVRPVERGNGSGFCHVVGAFLDLFLHVCFGIIEFAHATAQATHQLRDFLASEHQQYNDQNDDDLIGAQHTQQEILYHNN